ncbi:MAG: hypothetical protein HQK54_05745 [Oligoflexales bacterium]|nr:hypothetical protein [Oligoflexales bacterium]
MNTLRPIPEYINNFSHRRFYKKCLKQPLEVEFETLIREGMVEAESLYRY